MKEHPFVLWAMRMIDLNRRCEIHKGQRCYPTYLDEQCQRCHEKSEGLKD